MSRRLRVLAAVVVGVGIVIAGVGYASVKPSSYTSTSRLVLIPRAKSLNDISNLTSSFTSSGTAGTFVELIASNDTLAAAGASGLSAGVRAIPDSRVIQVGLQGAQSRVQPALGRLLKVARQKQRALNDDWTMEVLEGAQPATKSGPSTKLIFVATFLLAIFGGVLVLVALQRFGSTAAARAPRRGGAYGDDDEDDGRARLFDDPRLEAHAEP